ncbi:hypothetical protein ACSQ67_023293 [Phaseolus vulgaris]
MAEKQETKSPLLSAKSHKRRRPKEDPSPRKRGRSDGVRSWLLELELSKYAPIFELHEIDEESLLRLTMSRLERMGILPIGPRRIMVHAIQKLRKRLP